MCQILDSIVAMAVEVGGQMCSLHLLGGKVLTEGDGRTTARWTLTTDSRAGRSPRDGS